MTPFRFLVTKAFSPKHKSRLLCNRAPAFIIYQNKLYSSQQNPASAAMVRDVKQHTLLTPHRRKTGGWWEWQNSQYHPPEGRTAARLPTSGAVADNPQQAAGAAARIAERRTVHHPEVAARGGSQGVLPLEAGQAAYGQGSIGGQADGRHHRRETRAADSRLHPNSGNKKEAIIY